MKMKFLATRPNLVDLRPNSPTRQWMDDTHESFAYRCLPLNVANAHGWSFHLKNDFVVHWNGENTMEAITIKSEEDVSRTVQSIFGHGILTFHTHGVFQTEEGWSMMASGPANTPRDAIYPLTGVIETDWSPYSFTMNWKITRPGVWIPFKKGDVYCSVFPVKRGVLESIEPELLPIESDPELKEEHELWGASRKKFNEDLKRQGSYAQEEKWQKSYYVGKRPDGSDGAKDHVIKLRLKEFKKKFIS
ncbi:MAG TPA: DUF6065 family protein [Alphaproteobacteria bacterium]|nr:DUF6065 family protein [Alphaproteobacteria bacterium]